MCCDYCFVREIRWELNCLFSVGLSAFEQVLRKKMSSHFHLVHKIRMEIRTGYRRLVSTN